MGIVIIYLFIFRHSVHTLEKWELFSLPVLENVFGLPVSHEEATGESERYSGCVRSHVFHAARFSSCIWDRYVNLATGTIPNPKWWGENSGRSWRVPYRRYTPVLCLAWLSPSTSLSHVHLVHASFCFCLFLRMHRHSFQTKYKYALLILNMILIPNIPKCATYLRLFTQEHHGIFYLALFMLV